MIGVFRSVQQISGCYCIDKRTVGDICKFELLQCVLHHSYVEFVCDPNVFSSRQDLAHALKQVLKTITSLSAHAIAILIEVHVVKPITHRGCAKF